MLFRNRRLIRATAALLLVQIGGELLLPLTASAVSSPSQMEFVSYEAPGATDMVNLATGDFTYQVPLLEVPGPEMGFSVPLTYRAGIKLDQEASWTGLGWTLNPGAIVRNVNGCPDDANTSLSTTHIEQELARGWNAGVPGILQLGWDSNTGHHGSADLLGLAGLGWNDDGIVGGDIAGVGIGANKGSLDVGRMIGAAATIASLGMAGAASGAMSTGKAVALGAGKQLLTTAAAGTAAAMIAAQKGSGPIISSQPILSSVSNEVFYSTYHYYINSEQSIFNYGPLYFNKMSARSCNPNTRVWFGGSMYVCDGRRFAQIRYPNTNLTDRVASDYLGYDHALRSVNTGGDLQYIARPADNEERNLAFYKASKRAISIAYDNFSVMAPNIGGAIRPQRLDIGTVSYPHKASDHHDRVNAFPYPYPTPNLFWSPGEKVQFRYENTLSNSYRWQKYENSGGLNLTGIGLSNIPVPNGPDWQLEVTDPRLGTQRLAAPSYGVHTDVNPAQPTAKFVQGRSVNWWTNSEIRQMYGYNVNGTVRQPYTRASFLEFEKPTCGVSADVFQETTSHFDNYAPSDIRTSSSQITSFNPPRNRMPSSGIGAFAVTDDDGTRYHFSLPVYQYAQHSCTIGWEHPADRRGQNAAPGSRDNKYHSWSGKDQNAISTPVAIAWLLTAITAPDYKDQNANGVVDAPDIGGWVKFSYGKFGSQHKWRQPFEGRTYAEDDRTEYYAEGYRDSYYLNSIQTRSHTALFIKSIRPDGRGHRNPIGQSSDLGILENASASALRLDQIVLLNNQDYIKLTSGAYAPNDANAPAFTTNTANNATDFGSGHDLALGNSGDSYSKIYDNYDIDYDGRIRDFLFDRSIKRVVFNYTNELCPNVSNSFANVMSQTSNGGGKLTLKGLATYGPRNTKLMPDFAFRYEGPNPSYSTQKFDAFGMYSSVADADNHKPSADFTRATIDGAAWSLTDIVSPLGSHTKITYERDQYEKVSNEATTKSIRLKNNGNTSNNVKVGVYDSDADINLTKYFSNLDIISLTGSIQWGAHNHDDGTDRPVGPTTIEGCNVRVGEVTADSMTLTPEPSNIVMSCYNYMYPANPFPPVNFPNLPTYYDTPYRWEVDVETEAALNMNGDGIRVSSISTWDEPNQKHTIKYNYINQSQNNENRNSSGVISKAPASLKQKDYSFYGLPDYPETPVIYSQVQVYKGGTGIDASDWTEKEEYAFHTPDPSMIQDHYMPDYQGAGAQHQLERFVHQVSVNIGKIGQLDWVKKSNRRGEVEMASNFVYSNDVPNNKGLLNQGVFTDGVMTADWLDERYFRINRTVKEYQPTVVQKIITTSGSITTSTTNGLYDYYTGNVVGREQVTSTGKKIRTLSVPAYLMGAASVGDVYDRMGARGDEISASFPGGYRMMEKENYHMLAQTAATYAWLVRPGGPTDFTPNQQSMLSASAQTWRDNWNSNRGYYGATDRYGDTLGLRSVARQHESYTWHSPALNPDGTLASFTSFWGNATPSPAWVKTATTNRYDNYSTLLESHGLSQQYSAQKTYFSNSLPLAKAQNARYTEMAYCGLEDEPRVGVTHSTTTPNYYYGGEVKCTAARTAAYHHTGEYALELPATNNAAAATGLTYRALLKNNATSELTPARKYRLSTWVHSANAAPPSGRVFANLRKTNTDLVASWSANVDATNQAIRADGWYRLELVFELPAATAVANQTLELTVGCDNLNGTGTVYFDDFRFQPLDAALQAYVYDSHTNATSYVLDNDNFYSQYEYDAAGRVVKSWQETLDKPGQPGGARLVSKKIYHYRGMN